jgi:hypothetical protein
MTDARSGDGRRVLGFATVFVSIVAGLSLMAGGAFAKKVENHCLSPAGDDLNQVFDTRDAIIAPFCAEAHVGDRWRAVLRTQVAGAEFVFPTGYAPSQLPLDADFLAKLISATYVVDADTAREQAYTFSRDQLVIETGALPDGTRFARFLTPAIHPLPPGAHSVDTYLTLSDDFWDGLGVDPDLNLVPAGTSAGPTTEFDVVKRK